MSLRVGHQINYYSIPLQFYIIKRDKDNLNLSNTDSRLAEGKYDTALIKDEAKSSCKSQFLLDPSFCGPATTESKSGLGRAGVQGRIFRAKLTLISSPTAGWLDKKAAAISLIAAEDRPKPGDPLLITLNHLGPN